MTKRCQSKFSLNLPHENKKISCTITRSALAAAVVAAFVATAPGAAFAEILDSTPWHPISTVQTSEELQALSGSDRTFTVTAEGGFSSGLDAEQESYVSGIQVVGSGITANNFAAHFKLVGLDEFQVVGQTLVLRGDQTIPSLTLTGSTADISFTDDGTNSTVHSDNESTALMVSGGGNPNQTATEQKGSIVRFDSDAAVTTITVKSVGEHAGSVNGISVEGLSIANVTGKELNISVESSNDEPIGELDYTACGLSVVTHRLPNVDDAMDRSTGFYTSENTKLIINAKTTGSKPSSGIWSADGAATAIGISAEGGLIEIGGDAVINVEANGGTAVGAVLNAQALDYSDTSVVVDGVAQWNTYGNSLEHGHDTTFRKNLDMTVRSANGAAIGVVLAGSCCNLEDQEDNQRGFPKIRYGALLNHSSGERIFSTTHLTV